MKQVSVIVLNWNGKRLLEECFDALCKQSFNDFETILVDNGSKDGSVEFIKKKFPKIKILALPKNVGFARGNNEGIKIAKGEYIALLNNDTKVSPDWLKELYQGITSDARIGFCASKMIFYSNRGKIDTAGDSYSRCGAPFKRGCREGADKYNVMEKVFGACAGAAIYRKSMLDDIGLLDEDFFLGFEDSDLSFRAQLAGYECLYIPKAVVFHKVSATIGKTSKSQVYYGQRNLEYVYFKNMTAGLMRKYFFSHLVYNLVAFVYFTIKGRGWDFCKAKLFFLVNFGKIMKKRIIVQKSRRVKDQYLDKVMEGDCFKSRIKAKL